MGVVGLVVVDEGFGTCGPRLSELEGVMREWVVVGGEPAKVGFVGVPAVLPTVLFRDTFMDRSCCCCCCFPIRLDVSSWTGSSDRPVALKIESYFPLV